MSTESAPIERLRRHVLLTVRQVNELAKFVQVDGKEMKGCAFEPDDELVLTQFVNPQPLFDEDGQLVSHHRLITRFVYLKDEGYWVLDEPQEVES